MSMPIQRQSEQFAAFDTSPRWARDRESHDLPKGLAGLINTTGPRITGGLLNTRDAGMHYPDEYDPRVDGFPEEDPRRIVPTRAEAEADEYEGDDYDDYDYSLENHDPHRYIPENFVDPREARRGSGRHPFDRAAARRLVAFDWKERELRLGPNVSKTTYRAMMENGHGLVAHEADNPENGFHWSIYEPAPFTPKPGSPMAGLMKLVSFGGSGRDQTPSLYSGEHLPTLEHAKQQAEQAYQELYPIGTDTGSHDSGVDYSDLNSYLRHLESMRLAKGKCECWDGYERVPGTEPCAEGSCRKCDSHRKESGLMDRVKHFINPFPVDVEPWQQTEEGYEHPSGAKIVPTEDGQWQAMSPAGKEGELLVKVRSPHPDPQVLMDWHDYSSGGLPPEWHEKPRRFRDNMFPPSQLGPRTAAEMSYDDIMKRIDEQLAAGEPQSEIPRDGDPLHPSLLGRNQCQNCGHFATDHGEVNHVSIGDDYKGMFCWPCMDELKSTWYDKDGHYRTADLMPPQQMPIGGGYQIGHQVGLEWRPGSNINGTVIGLDPVSNSVKVRWADGQYSTEEPRNIHLL